MSASIWRAIFGNDRPVEIELGPGRGDVILAWAAAEPGTNFYGIEIRRAAAAAINARAADHGLRNVLVIAADARCVLHHCVPAASVAAYHVYFPDPWPKTRHRRRRLLQPGLADELVRTLVDGGRVHVASDLPDVFGDLRRTLEAVGLTSDPVAQSRPRPFTKFERKYAAGGTYAASFLKAQPEAGSPRPQKTS